MTWWAWIICGAILLGAELAFVDAQFYLVFVGTAAILVGIAAATVADLPVPLQWLAFSTLAIVSTIAAAIPAFRAARTGELVMRRE